MLYSVPTENSNRLDTLYVLSLILSVPTIPFLRYESGAFEIPVAFAVIGGYLCVKTLALLTDEKPLVFEPTISLMLIMLFLWSAASIFWAPHTDLAFKRVLFMAFTYLFIIFTINWCALSLATLDKLTTLLPAVIIIPVLVGFHGYFAPGQSEAYQFSYEFPRVIGNKNSDAFMILTGWPVAAASVFAGSDRLYWKLMSVGAVLLFAVALFLSLSRGCFFGAVAIFLLMLCVNAILTGVRFVKVVVILVACIILPLSAIGLATTNIVQKTTTEWFQKGTDSDLRVIFNRAALELAERNPLTGVGLGNYPKEFMKTSVGRLGVHDFNPHNSYLAALAELGIPGLTLLIIVVAWPFVSFLQAYPAVMRSQDPLVAKIFVAGLGLSIVLIEPLFAYHYTSYFYYWMIYGLTGLMAMTLKRTPSFQSQTN